MKNYQTHIFLDISRRLIAFKIRKHRQKYFYLKLECPIDNNICINNFLKKNIQIRSFLWISAELIPKLAILTALQKLIKNRPSKSKQILYNIIFFYNKQEKHE